MPKRVLPCYFLINYFAAQSNAWLGDCLIQFFYKNVWYLRRVSLVEYTFCNNDVMYFLIVLWHGQQIKYWWFKCRLKRLIENSEYKFQSYISINSLHHIWVVILSTHFDISTKVTIFVPHTQKWRTRWYVLSFFFVRPD